MFLYDSVEVINMSFSDNLRILRKREQMSQEALAEKLHVSRQAVSKWESEQGYPEMETLIEISNLFHCSIDHLIKDSLVESTLEEINMKALYEKQYKQFSLLSTLGIASILSGVSLYLPLAFLFPTEKTEFIPTVVFMAFIAVGVIAFIIAGTAMDSFKKRHKEIPSDMYSNIEKDQFNKKFSLAMATGVGLILIGVILQVLIDATIMEELASFMFMVCITTAVSIFVYYGTQKSKFETLEVSTEQKSKETKMELIIGCICGIVMIIATIIFFLWSFLYAAWQISWIVFPIGGLICGIVTLAIQLYYANK